MALERKQTLSLPNTATPVRSPRTALPGALVAVLLCGLVLTGCVVKPKPFTESEQAKFGKTWLDRSTRNQEPLSGPVSLYEAMARALKYNLDVKVEVREQALRVSELTLANQAMLPDLVVNSGYAGRNEADASSSSTRDPDILSADLAFSWNILDFGLSYVRAKQAADQVLVQQEMRRKIANRLIEDVRTAYWRAASYDRLVRRMRALETRVAGALAESRQISGSGENSPLVPLLYERELLEIQGQIETLENEMLAAKTQLSALMDIQPGTEFQLEPLKRKIFKPALPNNLQELYRIAVTKRPEMRELAYKLRINDQELNAAVLQLLPNFNVYGRVNYDSNEFISPADWVSWGGRVTWNLLKAVSLPATADRIEAQEATLRARAKSVAVAIMTQVQVSRIRYAHLLKRYRTADAMSTVSNKILNQVKAEAASDRATQQNLIQEEMNALLADARQDMVHADVQSALATFFASLGLDPVPADLDIKGSSVDSIAAVLENCWKGNGAMPVTMGAELANLSPQSNGK